MVYGVGVTLLFSSHGCEWAMPALLLVAVSLFQWCSALNPTTRLYACVLATVKGIQLFTLALVRTTVERCLSLACSIIDYPHLVADCQTFFFFSFFLTRMPSGSMNLPFPLVVVLVSFTSYT